MSYKEYKFSELCSITRGASPRPIHDYLAKEGMPWIKISDATAEKSPFIKKTKECIKHEGVRASVKVYKGDLILSNSATPGLPKFLEIDACIHDGWMLLRDFKNIRKEYAYWLLLNERVKLVAKGNGSVFTNLKTDILKNHIVKVPTFEVQDKAVSILDGLNNKINLLDETNKTLESIAQAIFKSWFIDFDPVHAKQQGKECAGIDKATADLFPSSFVESELGLIPKDWEVKSLGDKVVPKRGKTITKSTTTTGEVPVVAGGLDPAYFHNQSNVLSPAITISSSGANAGFVRLYQQDIWASDCCYISSEQNQEVFYWYIFLKANQEKIYFMQQGAAQPHIYASDLMRLTICSPKDSKLVTAFNTLVTPLFNRIKISNNQIEALSNLRDTLLPRLISGKVDLSNIEEELEGIA